MLLKTLKSLITGKPYFTGSPEMFLAMMLDMERQGRENDPRSASATQLAGVFMKVMSVDLYPYQSFAELEQKGIPDYSLVEKAQAKIQELRSRREMKKAIYGDRAGFDDNDPLYGNSEGALFARNFADKIGKHVQFKPDE